MARDSSGRLRDRLVATAGGALVGRSAEEERLIRLIHDGAAPVVFVHGPGGIGKTALVQGVLARRGFNAVTLSHGEVEPTQPGFLGSLGAAAGVRHLRSAVEAADALHTRGVKVVVVDGVDRLHLLDGWLRNQFAAAMPDGMTLVMVGRRRPNIGWRSSPGWRHLIAELPVGPLSEEDVAALLSLRGVTGEDAARVAQFCRGHPLAVELAIQAVRRHPRLNLGPGTPTEVTEELFTLLLDDLSPVERIVVERVSVLRRITRPALAAVLGEDLTVPDVEAARQLLRSLPITDTTSGGLRLHGVAHAVIAEAVEMRDPRAVRSWRARVAKALLRDMERDPDWGTTADLLHLVQNPVIRHAYQPPVSIQHAVESAMDGDLVEVLALAESFEGTSSRRLLERWWQAHPEAFAVARGERGEVKAFSVVTLLDEVPATLGGDPVLHATHEHLQRRPMPTGARALVVRSTLGRPVGERRSPEVATMVVDLKRHYLEHRRRLRRVYTVVQHWDELAPQLRTMGFEPLGPVQVGATGFTLAMLDFGARGVDGWLGRHVLAESLAVPEPYRAASGPVATLSPRELEVLVLLADGRTNRELAELLFISERTANRHVSNVFTKLAVHNRTAAARVAVDAGLVS